MTLDAPKLTCITHRNKYGGVTTVGVPFREADRFYRRDRYQPTDDSPVMETIYAAGPEDHSRPHRHSSGDTYDAVCPCCYLGINHTTERHAQSLDAAAETRQAVMNAALAFDDMALGGRA